MSKPKYGPPGVKKDNFRYLIDGKSKILSRDINDCNNSLTNLQETVLGEAPTFWCKRKWSEDKVLERKAPYITNNDGTSIFPTVGHRLDYIQNQVEHITRDSNSGLTYFTFAPGKAEDKSRKVYSSWGSLYLDLRKAVGIKVIFFDDEKVSGRIRIPKSSNDKPYDMTGVQWMGSPDRTDPCEDTLSKKENNDAKTSYNDGFYSGNDSGMYSEKSISGHLNEGISKDEYEFIKFRVPKYSNLPESGYLNVNNGAELLKYSGAKKELVGLSKEQKKDFDLYKIPILERGVIGGAKVSHVKETVVKIASITNKSSSSRTQVEIVMGARFSRIPSIIAGLDVYIRASKLGSPAFKVHKKDLVNPDSVYYREKFHKASKDSSSSLIPCDEVRMVNSSFTVEGSSVPPISIGINSRVRFFMEGSKFLKTSYNSAELISLDGIESELEVFGDKDSKISNNCIRGKGYAVLDIPDYDSFQPNFSGNSLLKGGVSPDEISVDNKHLRTKNGITIDGQVLAYNKHTNKVGFSINGLNSILKQDNTSYFGLKCGGVLVETELYKHNVSEDSGSFATSLQGQSSVGKTAKGYASSIVGGAYNEVEKDASYSVAGGLRNIVGGVESAAFGGNNSVYGDRSVAFGSSNTSDITSEHTALFGYNNEIDSSDYSTIFGQQSKISLSGSSAITSGYKNELKSGSDFSVIIGGRDNVMQSTSSVILGGRENFIKVSDGEPSSFSSIVFGYKNTVIDADHSAILSGDRNTIISQLKDGYSAVPLEYSAIISGCRNRVTAPSSMVLGGKGALAEKEGDIVIGWSESGEASSKNNTIVMNAKTGDITTTGSIVGGKKNIKMLLHGSNQFELYGQVSPAVYNVQPSDEFIAVDSTAIEKDRRLWENLPAEQQTTASKWYSGPIKIRLPSIGVTKDSGQPGRTLMIRHVCGSSPVYVYPSEDDEKLLAQIDWNDHLVISPGEAFGVFETHYGWFIW